MPELPGPGRRETRLRHVTEKHATTEVCDQTPDIIEVAEIEHPLNHPQSVFLQVISRELSVPEQTLQLLDDLGLGRSVGLSFSRHQRYGQFAPQRGSEFAQRRDFESRPAVLIPGHGGNRGVGPSSQLSLRQTEGAASLAELSRHVLW